MAPSVSPDFEPHLPRLSLAELEEAGFQVDRKAEQKFFRPANWIILPGFLLGFGPWVLISCGLSFWDPGFDALVMMGGIAVGIGVVGIGFEVLQYRKAISSQSGRPMECYVRSDTEDGEYLYVDTVHRTYFAWKIRPKE